MASDTADLGYEEKGSYATKSAGTSGALRVVYFERPSRRTVSGMSAMRPARRTRREDHGAVGRQASHPATVADGTGFYNLLAMPPGVYDHLGGKARDLRADPEGRRAHMSQNLRLDVTLKVGASASRKSLSRVKPLSWIRRADALGLVDGRRVQDCRLNGRNIMSLTGSCPGILNVTAPQELANTRAVQPMSVNGGRSVDNITPSTAPNFTHFGQTTGMNFPSARRRAGDSGPDAQLLGRVGNTLAARLRGLPKSGSNQFHGTAEFCGNDKLNARSFFKPRRPNQPQNQAGAVGGADGQEEQASYFGYYQKLWNRPEVGSTVTIVRRRPALGDFSASRVAYGTRRRADGRP